VGKLKDYDEILELDRGMARLGPARPGEAWHGTARHGFKIKIRKCEKW